MKYVDVEDVDSLIRDGMSKKKLDFLKDFQIYNGSINVDEYVSTLQKSNIVKEINGIYPFSPDLVKTGFFQMKGVPAHSFLPDEFEKSVENFFSLRSG